MIDITNKRGEDTKEQRDIEELIASENNPKIRLQLIVMNRINLSLIANTETINEIAEKLDAHLSVYNAQTIEQQALLNKGKGAWRIAAWILGIVQVVAVASWVDSRAEITQIHNSLSALVMKDTEIMGRITNIEKK